MSTTLTGLLVIIYFCWCLHLENDKNSNYVNVILIKYFRYAETYISGYVMWIDVYISVCINISIILNVPSTVLDFHSVVIYSQNFI
jgi:hypothetical protein